MPTPEELARQNSDAQLKTCGWDVQELEGAIEARLSRAVRLRRAILKRAFEGRLG